MELTALIIMAFLLPFCTIGAFIIGYNVNASKKILKHAKKSKPTADEIMLQRIDNATVYDETE